jgi:hypothetical protein
MPSETTEPGYEIFLDTMASVVWLETLRRDQGDRRKWAPAWIRSGNPYTTAAAQLRAKELEKEGVKVRTVPLFIIKRGFQHRIKY